MSPAFIASMAVLASAPMQSSANSTGRLMSSDSAFATGCSESFSSRPFGRPKCARRMTLPPLSAISVMVGATRSIRVASVTLPFSIGTLRSTRRSTRLLFRSAVSRVRKEDICARSRVPGAAQRETVRCRTGTYRQWSMRSRLCDASLHAASRPGRERLKSACPSRPPCRTCGWRSPIRCRTTTSRAPACRPSPWSGPCGRSRNADRG